MPMIWIEPEVYLQHNGVTVYRAYKDADGERPLDNWFTTAQDDPDYEFDVRDLPDVKDEPLGTGEDFQRTTQARICAALDAGILPLPPKQ